MEILAQRLCALRKERKLSRKDVSERLEIAERTYQRYENAGREPTASVLVKMADFYGVTTDHLGGRPGGGEGSSWAGVWEATVRWR